MKYRFLFVVLLVFPLLGILSCQKEQDPVSEKVAAISLNTSTLILTAGETAALTVSFSQLDASMKLIWATSNPSVATVYGGVVTAVSAGQATITVRTEDGKQSAACAVTVNPAQVISVESVSLNKTTVELTVRGSETLVATVKPDNATNKKVIWSTNDTSVATVSSGGVVTALKAGTATITVTTIDGGKTDSCTVTVKENSNSGGNEDVYYDDWN